MMHPTNAVVELLRHNPELRDRVAEATNALPDGAPFSAPIAVQDTVTGWVMSEGSWKPAWDWVGSNGNLPRVEMELLRWALDRADWEVVWTHFRHLAAADERKRAKAAREASAGA